jgi:hypothetical protein
VAEHGGRADDTRWRRVAEAVVWSMFVSVSYELPGCRSRKLKQIINFWGELFGYIKAT